ncbi:hypothetical protein K437DRAFT_294682 [Tilletiaria anomala UBC 951]|uniref:Cep57 centrosome microtubule-binding domain-containing protein n=1 Tax=Tilletiaria anomala (strain ATCC 24038 / CBS 436.72 / UBC 951) TaxID=1037660 RepID=A0A066VTZ0_TILAU|nr:uncharacterized protein K437DRAFT_294682 [Tilletiaria anomala UBC 951]KDN44926.1 hypothetical protein K437DRAFT_294682 [Tilletiaria anomala UBC 951]
MTFYIPISAQEVERRKFEERMGYNQAARFSSDFNLAHTRQSGTSQPSDAASHRAQHTHHREKYFSDDVGDGTEIPGVGRGTYRPNSSPARRAAALGSNVQHLTRSNAMTQHSTERTSYPQISPVAVSRQTMQLASSGLQRPSMSHFASPSKDLQDPASRKVATRRNGDVFSSGAHQRQQQHPRASDGSDDSDLDSDCSSHHPPRFIGDRADSTGNHEALRATPIDESVDSYVAYDRRAKITEEIIERLEMMQDVRDAKGSEDPLSSRTKATRISECNHTKISMYHDPNSPFVGTSAPAKAQIQALLRPGPSPRVPIAAHSRIIRSPESPSPASASLSRQSVQHRAAADVRPEAHAGSGSDAGAAPRRKVMHSIGAAISPAGSAFGVLAAGLKKDLRGIEDENAERSSSSGSGFVAGSQESSAATKVDHQHPLKTKEWAGSPLLQGKRLNHFYLPSGQDMGPGAPATGLYLPDVTGLTSALNSPDKERVGVRHVPVGENVGTNGHREEQLQRLETYVEGMKAELVATHDKIRGLEVSQESLVANVIRINEQMSGFQEEIRYASKDYERAEKQTRREPLRTSQSSQQQRYRQSDNSHHDSRMAEPSTSMVEGDGLSDQIQELTFQLQHSQAEIQRLREEQQHRKSATFAFASAAKSNHSRADDSELQQQILELRSDVARIASELGQLRGVVEGHVVENLNSKRNGRRSTVLRGYGSEGDEREDDGGGRIASEHRARFENPLVASSPIKKSASMRKSRSPFLPQQSQMQHRSRDEHSGQRESTNNAGSAQGFFHAGSQHDADETVRPTQTRLVDEEDISMVAQERAEATFRSVATQSGCVFGADDHSHDPRKCTVCSRARKSERRRHAKREKLEEIERKRTAMVQEEEALLAFIDASVADGGPKNAKAALILDGGKLDVLQRVIEELLDDFWHQREIYCSLADELKLLEPHEYRYKITSTHVLEAVDALEYKAERINLLHSLLPGGPALPTMASRRSEHAAVGGSSKQSHHHYRQATSGDTPVLSSRETRIFEPSRFATAGKKNKGKHPERGPVTLRTVLNNSPPHVNEME